MVCNYNPVVLTTYTLHDSQYSTALYYSRNYVSPYLLQNWIADTASWLTRLIAIMSIWSEQPRVHAITIASAEQAKIDISESIQY